jgi:phosphoribosylamine---glycine ligase
VVVEEFLSGEEASFICIVGGGVAMPLASSQDHKRRFDSDLGPNTGGMGAYSPAPVVTPEIHDRVMREVINPTVRGLAAEGIDYTGFLYAGLMIDDAGAPRVIEFNCRFGDPETQPVLMRLKSDLVDLIDAALDGKLGGVDADWDARAALGVVLAAGDYPAGSSKGAAITGIGSETADGKVFHAGTALAGDTVVTAGGRVLCAVGLGDTVLAAQQRAYALAAPIRWDGVDYRRDIGYRAVAREG